MGISAALELRVHGVHGTSPASMLGVRETHQVAGDGITGVFRTDAELPRRTLEPGHAVEAYSWGALTSAVRGALGWVQRVLWLGLLPFALVNLAYWARLHVSEADKRGTWGAAVVRWAALLLTMLIVLTGCLVSLDLVAWQCYRGGTKSCDVLPGLLDFMMVLAPSQRLAVAALVPLAGIGVMWFLSRQSLARYEASSDSGVMAGGDHLLQDSRFWSSTRRTLRLQRLHLAGAVATVMAYVGAQVDRLAGQLHWWTVVAVLVLATCFGSLVVAHPQDLEHRGQPDDVRAPDRWAERLLRATVAAAVAQLGWLATPWAGEASREWSGTAGWYGHNLWFIGVFAALSVVNIAVFVAGRLSAVWSCVVIGVFVATAGYATWLSLGMGGERSADEVRPLLVVTVSFALVFFVVMLAWQLRQGRRHPDKAWAGAGAAVLIGASGWIALLFTTAAVTAGADYLNGSDQSVSDLTSTQRPVADAVATASLTGPSSDDLVVTVAGEAVLRDAIVVVGGTGSPRVLRGVVAVDSAEVGDDRRTLPDTVLRHGTVRLADDGLLLVDSCRVAAGDAVPASCHPETPGFVPGARLTVPDQALEVAPQGRLRLAVASPPSTPLVVPQVLVWAPVVQVLWALLAALIAIACAMRLRRRIGEDIKRSVVQDRVPTASRVDVRRKRVRAAYAHRAERLVELVAGMTVVSVLLLLCLSATGLPPNTLVATLLPDWRSDLPHLVASLSLYVVLGLSAGLVLLGSYVRRSEATRKAVGILWDLTTFWPRAAHPLSPPCYAERVVPELTTRVRWGLERGGLVVVSGHSQGSLIAAATLIRLDARELDHVRLVTYGSQLRALYGRVFPRVLGPQVLGNAATNGTPTFGEPQPDVLPDCAHQPVGPPGTDTLWDLLGTDGWRNLYRRSDPLGWRVFSDGPSPYDVRAPEVPRPAAGDPGPTVATHSGYQHSLEYRTVVAGWLGETAVDEAAWAIGEVGPLPEP